MVHPHVDKPTESQITELLQGKSRTVREIYLDTHRLMVDTVPDVHYRIDVVDGGTGYGARQYGYDGWGMAALAGHTKWVSLVFFRGTDLPDSDGLLEGTGKKVRHVKLRSPEQFQQRREALRALIAAAAQLNQS